MGDHFEDSTNGISRTQHLVHFFFHLLFSLGISAIQYNLVTLRETADLLPRNILLQRGAAHSNDVAEHLNPQIPQEQLGQGANSDPRRRLSR